MDLGAAAAAGRRGYIGRTAETMAGIEVGCIRIVGFVRGWVAGLEEAHSWSLDLVLDLIARGLVSLNVGRRGCSKSSGC